ncbi:alpha-L-rhamnosidase [Pedobacter sp. AK017]|uniref:family 78 glycoside hydrolase catalytic domain n=1 Tax=Pedobacter sp. AK017 TaxID=2723073 RepID=UPI00161C2C98|nr:family 78 glycoside hydrolase catalytic domain [Pedobacter sp. AK017]MBB5438811.1 alpha-L-rhamnosidase [Pedobacter sp. AK017]
MRVSWALFTVLIICNFFIGNAQDKSTIAFSGSSWIGTSYQETTVKRACPVFNKAFRSVKAIKSAKLYITALGLYEARLNGKRIGKDYFTPGITVYNKRLQYQEYDVGRLLSATNTFEITVGEGWYRGAFRGAKGENGKDNFGSQAGLLVALLIDYQDGTSIRIVSDDSWKCTEGPIRYSELYDGELYDHGFIIKDWVPVKIIDHPKDILIPSEAEPVRKHETFKPVSILVTPNTEQVVDFGQNIAGWVQLSVRGRKGDTIRVYHAEVLDKEGNFFIGNLRTAKAIDTYVLKGGGLEVLEPHFTYHGFRYAKISGFKATKQNCTAVALYSDLKKTGTFSCSDPMINRLQKNIEWSLNSNFFDIPTDCPQRSERLGWTGDAQVFVATASYLRDTRKFYSKWLKDLSAEQGKNGGIPDYVPTVAKAKDIVHGSAGWGDAATIIPWTVYQTYNDTLVLKNQYASMKAWVDYMKSNSQNGLWKANGYGDWYAPGPGTNVFLIDQCFWAYSTSIVSQAAKVLGKTSDAAYYHEEKERIKLEFVKQYVLPDGRLSSDTQTAYVLALAFDMLPQKEALAKRLVELIHENKDHLATGFLGTPYLLQVLSDNGYSDVAYTLLMQKTYPSWLFPVTMGATTIWEKWDGMDADGTVKPTSYNHYAYGAVGNWLYQYVAGIRPAAPGYKEVVIKPVIGGGLSWAKGSYVCDYGKIISEWKLNKGKVVMKVELPKGVTAKVYVPGEQLPRSVVSGEYQFNGKI